VQSKDDSQSYRAPEQISKQQRAAELPRLHDPRVGAASCGNGEHSCDLSAEGQLQEAVKRFTLYLLAERNNYYEQGRPLHGELRGQLASYFDDRLLDNVRVVELVTQRVANPWFYPIAREKGLQHLPDLPHKAAVTFLDVIVFNEKFAMRDLFHGLVHATQVDVMGVEEFARLFVRGFVRARSYFLLPLKAHAFSLDARFAADPKEAFSVRAEVQRWWKEDRY